MNPGYSNKNRQRLDYISSRWRTRGAFSCSDTRIIDQSDQRSIIQRPESESAKYELKFSIGCNKIAYICDVHTDERGETQVTSIWEEYRDC